MRILYKYLGPSIDDNPLPRALRNQTLLAADPRTFNDPFEVRPYFDQERHDYFAKCHEDLYGAALGVKYTLLKGRSMVGVPVENAPSFGDTLNQKFRDAIGQRFRVLCMSENSTSPLMWAHYTQIYRGAVIGIDVEDPALTKGMQPEGFSIAYSTDRSTTKLPLAFYQCPSVEHFDVTGKLVNSPMESVLSGGVTIFFYQYQQQLEEAYIRALSTKAKDWEYEREVRFIYDLFNHGNRFQESNGGSLIPIPPSAIKEVILGFNASVPMVERIVTLYGNGALGNARLFYTTCHPHLFEVQKQETSSDYLLDYFRIILPSRE